MQIRRHERHIRCSDDFDVFAQDHELPSTGVPLDFERLLSSRFIRSPDYGTRACSVVTIGINNQVSFEEQNYSDSEHSGNLIRETFETTS